MLIPESTYGSDEAGLVFGMNVGGIPLAEHPWGFWRIVVLVSTFTAVAAFVGWRRR